MMNDLMGNTKNPAFANHKSKIILAAIISFSAVICMLRLNSFQVGALYDDAHYAILAESLSSGQGYRLINFPDAPPEVTFPPGWPLLLSPIAKLFPNNYQAYKVLSIVFWLAALLVLHRFFTRRMPPPYPEILTGTIALIPGIIGLAVSVMSDPAYLFFSLTVLNWFDRCERDQEAGKRQGGYLELAAIVLLALFTQLIRTAGLAILLALVLHLLLKRRFLQAGLAAAISAAGLIPQLWLNRQNGGFLISSGYQSQMFDTSLLEKSEHIWANLQVYLNSTIVTTLVPVFTPGVTAFITGLGLGMVITIFNLLILGFIGYGLILAFKNPGLHDIYTGLYFLAILNFWNPEAGAAHTRFLLPLVPFLYYHLLQAIRSLIAYRSSERSKLAMYAPAGIFAVIMLLHAARNMQHWRNPVRERMIDLSVGTEWIAMNAPPDSIIMSINPISHYLYANRKMTAYPDGDDDIRRYILENSIDYIIVSEELSTVRTNQLGDYASNILLPELESDPVKYQVVYTNATHNVTVYAVNP